MRSLRGTLTAGLLGVGSLLLLAALAASYGLANGILERQFDRGLLERTTALATLLEQVGERVELHFADEVMPLYAAPERPEYFQLWSGKRVLERSVSLVLAGDAHLPRPARARPGTSAWNLALPDGRAGRALALETPVHHYAPDPLLGSDPGPATVLVVVAIERADLEAALRKLLLGVLGLGALLGLSLLFLGTRVLAHGLRPLERLTGELARIERRECPPGALASLDLPRELAPVAQRIGSLTTSLQEALARERRTSANIAHELRTPVAELRAVTEVALQTPEDVAALRQGVAESRDIAVSMQAMISTLLVTARERLARAELPTQDIALAEVVRELWQTFEPRARARGLEWTLRLEPPIPLARLNEEALRTVLGNLFDNACSHGRAGGQAECALRAAEKALELVVSNEAEHLTEADLARFGEPFWRADEARSDRAHFGLGLALAHECAQAAGLQLRFRLEEGWLQAVVSIPRR